MDSLLVRIISHANGLPDPRIIISKIEKIFGVKVTQNSKEKYFVCVRTIAVCVLKAYGFNLNQIKVLLKYKQHTVMYGYNPFIIGARISYIQEKYPDKAEEFGLEFGIDICLLCVMSLLDGFNEAIKTEIVRELINYYDKYARLPKLMLFDQFEEDATYMDATTKTLFTIRKEDFGFDYGWSDTHINSALVVARAYILKRYYERQLYNLIKGN